MEHEIKKPFTIKNTILGVGVKKGDNVFNVERLMVELPEEITEEIYQVILKHWPDGVIPKKYLMAYTTWDYHLIKERNVSLEKYKNEKKS